MVAEWRGIERMGEVFLERPGQVLSTAPVLPAGRP